MKEWKDDKALFSLIKEELYTAVIGDIMDKMGDTRQFLPPQIRPLRDDMLVAGRAMTVLEADVLDHGKECGQNPLLKRSFGLMLEALDDLKENEVYVCSGSSPAYALWGELMMWRWFNNDFEWFAVVRVDECPCHAVQGGRCGREWLFPRYERDPGTRLPLFLLRAVCTGSGAPWKGDRLPCPH